MISATRSPSSEARHSGSDSLVDLGATWFVTNGIAVIGPVDTALLVRGVRHGKVTSDCMVKQPSWKFWRGLNEIRERAVLWPEIAGPRAGSTLAFDAAAGPALVRSDGAGAPPFAQLDAPPAPAAGDFGEALLVAMHALVLRTHADVALVHRVREPFVGLVTSCAHGDGADAQLGEVLRSYDAAVEAARGGWSVMGHPLEGQVKRAVARRLAGRGGLDPLRAVAMAPVVREGRLLAMFELGRFDHPFRGCDADVLATVCSELAARDWPDLLPRDD